MVFGTKDIGDIIKRQINQNLFKKISPSVFLCRGKTRIEIYNYQHYYFPKYKGRGFKIIKTFLGRYPSEYEIFNK